MKILILGAPGAGKGTQAHLLSEQHQIIHISTGEILRTSISNGTPTGEKAGSYVRKGKLVPDSIMVAVINERLDQEDARAGYILDGFPRNLSQMKVFNAALEARQEKITWGIYIYLDDDTLFERLMRRSKEEGRKDDTPAVVRKRMETFHEHTMPMISYLEGTEAAGAGIVGNFLQIDGNQSRDAVYQQINEQLMKTNKEVEK